MAKDNKLLGQFNLTGIPPSMRGMPQIEVTFDVDANGILSVTAKDKATNKEQSIRIEASSGLSEDDINRMQADAESHSTEDAKKREAIEVRNVADQLIYTAEKSLRDNAEKISDELKHAVNEKIEELKKVKDGNDASAISKASESLSQEMQRIGEAIAREVKNEEGTKQSEGPEGTDEGKSGEDAAQQ